MKILITYEDENGVVTPVEKEVQLYVTEPVYDDPGDIGNIEPEPVPEEPSKLELVKKYALPIGIFSAAAVILIVILVKRKKKKAGMDDEIH